MNHHIYTDHYGTRYCFHCNRELRPGTDTFVARHLSCFRCADIDPRDARKDDRRENPNRYGRGRA